MIVKICVVVVFCILYWLMCYLGTGGDEKNIKSFRSYPDEVKEIVKKDEMLSGKIPGPVNMTKVFLSNVILFAVVFLVIGVILRFTVGFRNFVEALIYFVAFGQIINLFDLLVIDLMWWRNSPRIRFSCAKEKSLYKNPKPHVASFVRGIVMFLIPSVIAAGIVSLF